MLEKELNLDYYYKAHYISKLDILPEIDRRKVAGSNERNEIADRHTDCTSANQCRDRSKPKFITKNIDLCKEEQLVRLYDDDKKTNENDEAAFKAKNIPKSHKIPHMIFHSIKGLTQPQEFKFHNKKKSSIEEAEYEDMKEDDEAQMIISNEYVQSNNQPITKINKQPLAMINELLAKPKAFNYMNNSKKSSPNKIVKCTEQINEIEMVTKAKRKKYDIKDLLSKVKEHAKRCRDKSNNKDNNEMSLEQFEHKFDQILDNNKLILNNIDCSATDSIDIISSYDSNHDSNNQKNSKIQSYLDTSIGSMLSSSMSSNYNMQTITLSSMDTSEFAINKENIFGGMCDIDAIIKDQENIQ